MALCTISTLTTGKSRCGQISPLFIALLSLSSVLVTFTSPATAQNSTAVEIGSSRLDHAMVNGRRWTRVNFDPLLSGTHTIRIASNSKADIRFSIFRIVDAPKPNNKVRVGTTSGTKNPRKWTGRLEASEQYFLGVWSAAKSGDFTAILQAEPRVAAARGSVTDPIPVKAAGSWQLRGTANADGHFGKNLVRRWKLHRDLQPQGWKAAPASTWRRWIVTPANRPALLQDSTAPVWALALSPNKRTLYVGGSFRTAEGLTRKRIAAYNVRTGELTNFVTPAPNGALRAIAVDKKKVYVGGLFTKVGNERRKHVAAFDPATGKLDRNFVASPNDMVKTMVAGIESALDRRRLHSSQRRQAKRGRSARSGRRVLAGNR